MLGVYKGIFILFFPPFPFPTPGFCCLEFCSSLSPWQVFFGALYFGIFTSIIPSCSGFPLHIPAKKKNPANIFIPLSKLCLSPPAQDFGAVLLQDIYFPSAALVRIFFLHFKGCLKKVQPGRGGGGLYFIFCSNFCFLMCWEIRLLCCRQGEKRGNVSGFIFGSCGDKRDLLKFRTDFFSGFILCLITSDSVFFFSAFSCPYF